MSIMKSLRIVILTVCVLIIRDAFAMAGTDSPTRQVNHAAEEVDLSKPVIVHAKAATDMEKLAAKELLRYLYACSGKLGEIVTDDSVPEGLSGTVIVLDVAGNNMLAADIEKRKGIAVETERAGFEPALSVTSYKTMIWDASLFLTKNYLL